MSSGSLAGFPVVDVKATLYDGSYHDVDSSVLAFQVRLWQLVKWLVVVRGHAGQHCWCGGSGWHAAVTALLKSASADASEQGHSGRQPTNQLLPFHSLPPDCGAHGIP